MLKKEILLLDNTERKYVNKKQLQTLEDGTELEIVFGEDRCNELLTSFLTDRAKFNNYTTIIIHKNIYKEEQRKQVFKELAELNITLVIFSGGNESYSLKQTEIELPAKKIYAHLKIFIKAGKHRNLLMLIYGEKWKLNILLNVLEKINIVISEKINIDFNTLKIKVPLIELKNIMPKEEYTIFINRTDYESEISRDQIIHIQQNINNKIEELL